MSSFPARLNYLAIFKFYQGLLANPIAGYANGTRDLKLPIIPAKMFKNLLSDVTEVFKEESTLLIIEGNFVVVGDLHGHLLDLLRILSIFKVPPTTQYLFLGDMIDRGEFSTEVVSLIFIMKILWPKNIFIIRGNHEFDEICSANGFREELMLVYNDTSIYEYFLRAFSYLPLAAINKTTLFVHGGIGPRLYSTSQIANVKRPINVFANDVIADVLWSDPDADIEKYAKSSRGSGHLFGYTSVCDFLGKNGLDKIIRGHQCVFGGIEETLKSKVATVFSASNYCGNIGNRSGVLCFDSDGFYEIKTFDPIQYIARKDCYFLKSESDELFSINSDRASNSGAVKESNSSRPLEKITNVHKHIVKSSNSALSMVGLKSRNAVMLPNSRKLLISYK